MKRDASKPPYLSICMIIRNAEKYLPACFASIRERAPAAELCVLLAGKSHDRTEEIVNLYADVVQHYAGPRGDWDDMAAFDDAAHAREKSFELASPSSHWIMWLDADDTLPGPEQAAHLLKLNGQYNHVSPGMEVDPEAPSEGTLENLLREIETKTGADIIWLPYLYQSETTSVVCDDCPGEEFASREAHAMQIAPDLHLHRVRRKHGTAMVWQERERIARVDLRDVSCRNCRAVAQDCVCGSWSPVRAPLNFRWSEAAHEILVPKKGHRQRKLTLTNFLVVHEKDFSQDEFFYNISRHYAIALKAYEAGDRTTRRAVYLAQGARFVDPPREYEFVKLASEVATTPTDRYRAKCLEGVYWSARGLMWDALEAFGAAVNLRPDLPDAWIAGAEQWLGAVYELTENGAEKIEFRGSDLARGIEWLEKALALPFNTAESYVPPRHMRVRYPATLAAAYQTWARAHVEANAHERAQELFAKATQLYIQVRESQEIGDDKIAVQAFVIRAADEEEAQTQAIAIWRLVDYLIRSDEPQKALELLRHVPWNLEDHPLITTLQRRLAPVEKHLEDLEAYVAFYNNANATGFIPCDDKWLEPENALYRVKWMIDEINRNCPNAIVLDMGCFDGITGIPLLRGCPGISYLGVEMFKEAAELFRSRLATFRDGNGQTLDKRANVLSIEAFETEFGAASTLDRAKEIADVLVWTEVIEHVQSPQIELRALLRYVKPDGRVFITTPWGAYDKGHPPEKTALGTPRDSRGHVRAYSPAKLLELLDASYIGVEELWKDDASTGSVGDGMNVILRPYHYARDLNFFVPGALWDWNGRISKAQGIGASEGQIILLGETLAKGYTVTVYGPTPDVDVHRRVRYQPRSQMRHADPNSVAIISRSPHFAPTLDQIVGEKVERKILWLQDVSYDGFNAEVAAQYEKIVVVSEWHKQATHELHGVPLEMMEVIYNFVMPEHFCRHEAGSMTETSNGIVWRCQDHCRKSGSGYRELPPKRQPHRFIYASSPDRGIVRCLEVWPKIREALPDAELHVFYGWRGMQKLGLGHDAAWNRRYEATRKAYEKLRHQPGVVDRGMVGFEAMARELMQASVWLHPSIDVFNQPFFETCCTLAIQARAAGCVPVCAPVGALAETAETAVIDGVLTGSWKKFVDPNDLDGFAQAAVAATELSETERGFMSKFAIRDFGVAAMLPRWLRILEP